MANKSPELGTPKKHVQTKLQEVLCRDSECTFSLVLFNRVVLRVCVPGRMPISGLWPEIGKKKSPKNRFWPRPENREKNRPKKGKTARKPIFKRFFPIFGRFFPYFPGEAKIDFSAIFFRPKSAFSQARILARVVRGQRSHRAHKPRTFQSNFRVNQKWLWGRPQSNEKLTTKVTRQSFFPFIFVTFWLLLSYFLLF